MYLIKYAGTKASTVNPFAMSVAALAAFARMNASHAAFVASYKTAQRPAAIAESDAADVEFMAAMEGLRVWVKADYVAGGLMQGRVSMSFERGDVRTEHGVNNWGEFCPSSYSRDEAEAFFRADEALSARACALDEADYVPATGTQTLLIF